MGAVSGVEVIAVAGDCWSMLMASCLLLAGKSPRRLGFELSLPPAHPSPDDSTPRRSTESYITTRIPLPVPHPCVLGSISCTLAVLTHLLFLAVHILAFPMYLLNFLGLWNGICKQ